MVWYKSWLDTRWRFLIPLGVLVINIWGLILEYPHVAGLLRTVQIQPDALSQTGALGRTILESVTAERTYRGYIWYQWFRNNLSQLGTLFAVLLGSGSLLSGSTGTGTLFTLSLPASRNGWLAARAAVGLVESVVLALIPSIEIVLLSPLVGERYAMSDAVVQALCLFVVGAVFFSLAFLLSTMFNDTWRPMLIAGGIAIVISVCESQLALNGPFRVMSAASYFASGSVPWAGLFLSAAAAGALLYGAARNVAHHDF
jgi:hypothetical protein